MLLQDLYMGLVSVLCTDTDKFYSHCPMTSHGAQRKSGKKINYDSFTPTKCNLFLLDVSDAIIQTYLIIYF